MGCGAMVPPAFCIVQCSFSSVRGTFVHDEMIGSMISSCQDIPRRVLSLLKNSGCKEDAHSPPFFLGDLGPIRWSGRSRSRADGSTEGL